jgi:hypothetical protein
MLPLLQPIAVDDPSEVDAWLLWHEQDRQVDAGEILAWLVDKRLVTMEQIHRAARAVDDARHDDEPTWEPCAACGSRETHPRAGCAIYRTATPAPVHGRCSACGVATTLGDDHACST